MNEAKDFRGERGEKKEGMELQYRECILPIFYLLILDKDSRK